MPNQNNKPERQTKFELSPVATNLSASIPSAEEFRRALLSLPAHEISGYVRGYVRNRVPAAFSNQPLLWEAIRNWVSIRIKSDPHEIGLNGSAQLGFSPTPSKYGKEFSAENSDLDFFIISNSVFDELGAEIRQFCANGSDIHQKHFENQIHTLQSTLGRSFFDLKHIPAVEKYPKCSQAKNISSIIVHKLGFHGFQLKHSHFRIYRSWPDFSRQMKINYLDIRKSLGA